MWERAAESAALVAGGAFEARAAVTVKMLRHRDNVGERLAGVLIPLTDVVVVRPIIWWRCHAVRSYTWHANAQRTDSSGNGVVLERQLATQL